MRRPSPSEGARFRVEPRQWLAGLLFGLAATARLTVAFGAPFYAFVGPGDVRRRVLSAGLGAAIPIGVLVLYNVVTTGQVLHPAYDHLYRLESVGYPTLGYHPDWAAEDPRYVPQNLGIALFGTPSSPRRCCPRAPPPARRLSASTPQRDAACSLACPLAVPRDTGMSVILTSPAYLLAIRSCVATGAAGS